MDEYISREAVINITAETGAWETQNRVRELPAEDIQPLTVVAEHIKKRLYQTAFNTTEEKARDTIADMAKRIDIWVDELKVGDVE
jgi:hypothetical protein